MHVRPQMEYCGQTWDPVYSGDTIKMEKVQNRFTKLLRHGRVMTPAERNEALGITDHKTRRMRGDLIYMFKLMHNENLFTIASDGRTRGHSRRLRTNISRNNLRKHSFTERNVALWNSLPDNVVNSESLNIFKNKLDEYLSATLG